MRLRLPKLPRRIVFLALGLVAGLILALLYMVFTINTPVQRLVLTDELPPPADARFVELIGTHVTVPIKPGNEVEILVDGDGTFPRLWQDLAAARRSISLLLYFCQPGRLADALAARLTERARAGVTVRFLYDGFACDDLGDHYFDRLRAAGVDVRSFRPLKWWSLHKAQERSHGRIVVVDGRIGYTGGFGIDDRWSAEGADGKPGWRETNVRFTGPAVAQLEAAFVDGWAEATGEFLIFASDASAAEPGVSAGLFHSTPARGSTPAERMHALTIAATRSTLYIANAYFVPDDDLRRMLIAAARRGVDVRVLAPDDQTDVPIVRYAGRAHFQELLDGGVRIYEYQAAMMHAKTFVADGVWAGIGSMNLDNRSMAVNEETVLLVHDPGVGAAMDSLFRRDLERATELTADAYRKRGFGERLKERLAVLGSRVM